MHNFFTHDTRFRGQVADLQAGDLHTWHQVPRTSCWPSSRRSSHMTPGSEDKLLTFKQAIFTHDTRFRGQVADFQAGDLHTWHQVPRTSCWPSSRRSSHMTPGSEDKLLTFKQAIFTHDTRFRGQVADLQAGDLYTWHQVPRTSCWPSSRRSSHMTPGSEDKLLTFKQAIFTHDTRFRGQVADLQAGDLHTWHQVPRTSCWPSSRRSSHMTPGSEDKLLTFKQAIFTHDTRFRGQVADLQAGDLYTWHQVPRTSCWPSSRRSSHMTPGSEDKLLTFKQAIFTHDTRFRGQVADLQAGDLHTWHQVPRTSCWPSSRRSLHMTPGSEDKLLTFKQAIFTHDTRFIAAFVTPPGELLPPPPPHFNT